MQNEMKIYTKTGDKGQTKLGDGSTVDKTDLRLDAFGTLDELNAHIGYLRDTVNLKRDFLLQIQNYLFELGAYYANPSGTVDDKKTNQKVIDLEKEIDAMNDELPELRNFIIPGGHPWVSLTHICRTVTRRAERRTVELFKEESATNYYLFSYINRLSDFFFVLGRYFALKLGVEETIWKPENDESSK